jgi:hypothetical protein
MSSWLNDLFFFFFIIACNAAQNSVGVQCAGTGMCINETLFCDGIVDCGFTGIDEGPLFCGEFVIVNMLSILKQESGPVKVFRTCTYH